MKLCILDIIPWEYNTDTPSIKALGGTQSAICYFLKEWNKKFPNSAYLFNQSIKEYKSNDNIIVYNINEFIGKYQEILPDIVISSCNIEILSKLKNELMDFYFNNNSFIYTKIIEKLKETKWGVWTGHDIDQPANYSLLKEEYLTNTDFFCFVSNWQRKRFIQKYNIPIHKTFIIRNGISIYAEKYIHNIPENKKNIITYTSVPFRGLEHFIEIFPLIKKQVPDCILRIYSGMNTYQSNEDNYIELYNKLKSIEGIEFNNGVNQEELSNSLKETKILAYPCIFQETSCISVIEAMAHGCYIVSSDLGALNETTFNNALLIENSQELNEKNYSGYYTKTFVNHIVNLLKNNNIYPDKNNIDILNKNLEIVKNNYLYSGIIDNFIKIIKNISVNIKFDEQKINYILNEGINYYNKKDLDISLFYWKLIENNHINNLQILKNIFIVNEEKGNNIELIEYGLKIIDYCNKNNINDTSIELIKKKLGQKILEYLI